MKLQITIDLSDKDALWSAVHTLVKRLGGPVRAVEPAEIKGALAIFETIGGDKWPTEIISVSALADEADEKGAADAREED